MRPGRASCTATAGIVLMLVALACFFALDTLLERVLRRRDAKTGEDCERGGSGAAAAAEPAP